MTTKTDYQAISELREAYKPQTRGFLTDRESLLIKEVLELRLRTDIELQNIRDMSVMVYSQFADRAREEHRIEDTMSDMDATSAICHIIDAEKGRRGLDV